MEVSGKLCALSASVPQLRAYSTHWIEGWVGTRAALNSFEKRESLAAATSESKLDSSNPLTSLITNYTILTPILNTCVLESVWECNINF